MACAIAVHPDGAPLRVLAFQHPLAGLQLPNGGIKDGETPLKAAARALWEETGLSVRAGLALGARTDIQPGETWHFVLLRPAPPVLETWRHSSRGDFGHVFTCAWHRLDDEPGFEGPFARAWRFAQLELAP